MGHKLIALMMVLSGLASFGWAIRRSFMVRIAPFDIHYDHRWTGVLVVLGIGLILGGIAVLVFPPSDRNLLLRMLFGTSWGALGAMTLGGMLGALGGHLTVFLGCVGAEVGLLGGVLSRKASSVTALRFGLVYGMLAGTLVAFGFLTSGGGRSLASIFDDWLSIVTTVLSSVLLGIVPGGLWGIAGSAIWQRIE